MSRKLYRVIRFGTTSVGVRSNLALYHEQVTRERPATITHSSFIQTRRVWQHWLYSRGLVSWMIETQMDAIDLKSYLEMEAAFDG